MLRFCWNRDEFSVIDAQTADGSIKTIDSWTPQPDLNDAMMGDLAEQHWGYAYHLLLIAPEQTRGSIPDN